MLREHTKRVKPMSDVEYFAGGTWLRVTCDRKVVREGDCHLSVWAVADMLARMGHAVEVLAAPGGSWVERAGGGANDGQVTYERVPEGVRVEYNRELANNTAKVVYTMGPAGEAGGVAELT